MNTFQKFMVDPKNIHVAWEIVKLYHPDIDTKYISPYSGKPKINKISVGVLYDWVVISGKFNYIPQPIGKRVCVDIGISFNPDFHGTGWSLQDFQDVHENNKFKAWRFKHNDSKYADSFYDDSGKFINPQNYDVNDIMVRNNVPRPTAKEMMRYYYSD